jgi:hypothetical protein
MTALKFKKVDILKLFAEKSSLFYYDPSSIWSIHYDFKNSLEHLNDITDAEMYLLGTGKSS